MLLLRLPSLADVYEQRAKILAFIVAALIALVLRQRERIAAQDAALAARPAVQDHVVIKRVQGPTRIEVRTIEKPGGERIVERIRYVESSSSERSNEHQETPAQAPVSKRTRYLGLEYAPIQRRAAARAALDIGPVEISVRHELRLTFEPWVGVGYRF